MGGPEVIGLAVALILIILSVKFVKDAIISHREHKKVKFCVAVICGVITILSTLYLIYALCFSQLRSLIGANFLLSILIIPMIWIVCFFINRRIMRIFLIFFSIILIGFCFLLFVAIITVDGLIPIDKSDAKYTTQEEVEKLLNMENLPKLKYDCAYGDACSYAYEDVSECETRLSLENPADSTKLLKMFKQLSDTERNGGVYYAVDNADSTYAHVRWNNKDIVISYRQKISFNLVNCLR